MAGKAHPADDRGKEMIRAIVQASRDVELRTRMVFLEDYDMNVARQLVQGVDVWLNNPRRPQEASGTSGQKAALNGTLNFSILDGWWAEAYDGTNGFAIGIGQTCSIRVQIATDVRIGAQRCSRVHRGAVDRYGGVHRGGVHRRARRTPRP